MLGIQLLTIISLAESAFGRASSISKCCGTLAYGAAIADHEKGGRLMARHLIGLGPRADHLRRCTSGSRAGRRELD
jgi:hypothetical protein